MSAVLIDGGREYFSILASLSGRPLKRGKYRALGHAVVLGHPNYYPRFGFKAASS
ncbi:hypothetical protein [Rossellomorea vietnamensis]|uniref:hypothetical protein n=1 Tax=Rossellomorea vietnamensis TaxID=218284 RepID=UPI001653A755|nr:hypothetical protein [Rossellomorea vietnamensis]